MFEIIDIINSKSPVSYGTLSQNSAQNRNNPFMPDWVHPENQPITNHHYQHSYQTHPKVIYNPTMGVVPQVRRNNDEVMRLIERYKILWQGLLCLKNDNATVQFRVDNNNLKKKLKFDF